MRFWAAEARERGGQRIEVLVFVADEPEPLVVPGNRHVGAWVETQGLDVDAAVRAAVERAGLAGVEVSGHTDPVGGGSWWRGIGRQSVG